MDFPLIVFFTILFVGFLWVMLGIYDILRRILEQLEYANRMHYHYLHWKGGTIMDEVSPE